MLNVRIVRSFVVRRLATCKDNKYAFEVVRPSLFGCRNFSCTTVVNSRRKSERNRKHGTLDKMMQKLDKFTLSVLRRWPFLHDYYHQMSTGFRRQSYEAKTWWRVSARLREKPSYKTTYHEHKALFDIKGSLLKSVILFPLFMLPMGVIIIFIPIALFPQYMLPHCYWSPVQMKKFFTQMHKTRSYQNAIIFHHLKYLQNNYASLAFRRMLEPILLKINNGEVVTNNNLMKLRDWSLTKENPLQLSEMPPLLLSKFCQVNFLWYMLPPSWHIFYLQRRVKLILEFDEKLRNENLIYDLSEREIQEANFLRGLDSANLSMEANQYWLLNWISHTSTCSYVEVSYILHAMVLQTHNFNELKYQRGVFDKT